MNTSTRLLLQDNMEVDFKTDKADLIYADMIYENRNFEWVDKYSALIKQDGVFIVQTDYHSVAELKVYVEDNTDFRMLNWLILKCEFGNFKKDRFRQCHDDILIFTRNNNYKWYPERIQVPKATAKSKGLNKSGRTTKLATSVITDICLTTVAKERIKKEDGKCVRWQKPIALLDRLFKPFIDEGDFIIDPFMGSGTSAEWCIRNNVNYVGIEYDSEVYGLANNRIATME